MGSRCRPVPYSMREGFLLLNTLDLSILLDELNMIEN
jgi:hypothetical protein